MLRAKSRKLKTAYNSNGAPLNGIFHLFSSPTRVTFSFWLFSCVSAGGSMVIDQDVDAGL